MRHFGSIFELPYKKLGAGCSSVPSQHACEPSVLRSYIGRHDRRYVVAARYRFASCRFACYRFARCRFARHLLAVALLAACFAHCCFARTSLPLCLMVWRIVDCSCSFDCAAQISAASMRHFRRVLRKLSAGGQERLGRCQLTVASTAQQAISSTGCYAGSFGDRLYLLVLRWETNQNLI